MILLKMDTDEIFFQIPIKYFTRPISLEMIEFFLVKTYEKYGEHRGSSWRTSEMLLYQKYDSEFVQMIIKKYNWGKKLLRNFEYYIYHNEGISTEERQKIRIILSLE